MQFLALQIFSRDRCILAHLSSRIKTLFSPTDDKRHRSPTTLLFGPIPTRYCLHTPCTSRSSSVKIRFISVISGKVLPWLLSFSALRGRSRSFLDQRHQCKSAVRFCTPDLGCSPCLSASVVGLPFPDQRQSVPACRGSAVRFCSAPSLGFVNHNVFRYSSQPLSDQRNQFHQRYQR
jgi:hypothetical protein